MKIMKDFEKSGNGDGFLADGVEQPSVREVTDEEFGKFNKTLYKTDHRETFLGVNGEECLYMWHMIDEHDLIPTTIATIDLTQAANSETVPVSDKIHNKRDKRKKDKDDDTDVVFAKSMSNVSYSELSNAKNNLEHCCDKYMDRLFDLNADNDKDGERRKYLEERIDKVKKEIKDIKRRM